MWWSVILAIFFVGALSKIPQHFIVSILGKGGTFKGLWRATLAGVLLDLCSHGILMVGMELRRKGASLGQVLAFLIASPWNSISLTIIMFSLIGLNWTVGPWTDWPICSTCIFDLNLLIYIYIIIMIKHPIYVLFYTEEIVFIFHQLKRFLKWDYFVLNVSVYVLILNYFPECGSCFCSY